MFIYYDKKLEKKENITITDKPQIIFSTIYNEKIINWLKEHNFHESFIEDIQSEDQSITYEESNEFKFLVLKYIKFDEEENLLYDDSNIVLIITKNKFFVLGEDKKIITEIAKKSEKRLKENTSFEYTSYIIADILIDNTILLIDVIDETLEDLEDSIFHENIQEDELQKNIYYARRTLNRITKVSIQEKDVLNKMYHKFPEKDKERYKYEFIDINEHLKYLVNESKTLLDRTGYLLNLHMGILSTRMNKAMQRLAAISLIFLPLTFVVGNYGMNFEYMPELQWKYGYLMVWGINISIALFIFIWLKRKKWI